MLQFKELLATDYVESGDNLESSSTNSTAENISSDEDAMCLNEPYVYNYKINEETSWEGTLKYQDMLTLENKYLMACRSEKLILNVSPVGKYPVNKCAMYDSGNVLHYLYNKHVPDEDRKCLHCNLPSFNTELKMCYSCIKNLCSKMKLMENVNEQLSFHPQSESSNKETDRTPLLVLSRERDKINEYARFSKYEEISPNWHGLMERKENISTSESDPETFFETSILDMEKANEMGNYNFPNRVHQTEENRSSVNEYNTETDQFFSLTERCDRRVYKCNNGKTFDYEEQILREIPVRDSNNLIPNKGAKKSEIYDMLLRLAPQNMPKDKSNHSFCSEPNLDYKIDSNYETNARDKTICKTVTVEDNRNYDAPLEKVSIWTSKSDTTNSKFNNFDSTYVPSENDFFPFRDVSNPHVKNPKNKQFKLSQNPYENGITVKPQLLDYSTPNIINFIHTTFKTSKNLEDNLPDAESSKNLPYSSAIRNPFNDEIAQKADTVKSKLVSDSSQNHPELNDANYIKHMNFEKKILSLLSIAPKSDLYRIEGNLYDQFCNNEQNRIECRENNSYDQFCNNEQSRSDCTKSNSYDQFCNNEQSRGDSRESNLHDQFCNNKQSRNECRESNSYDQFCNNQQNRSECKESPFSMLTQIDGSDEKCPTKLEPNRLENENGTENLAISYKYYENEISAASGGVKPYLLPDSKINDILPSAVTKTSCETQKITPITLSGNTNSTAKQELDIHSPLVNRFNNEPQFSDMKMNTENCDGQVMKPSEFLQTIPPKKRYKMVSNSVNKPKCCNQNFAAFQNGELFESNKVHVTKENNQQGNNRLQIAASKDSILPKLNHTLDEGKCFELNNVLTNKDCDGSILIVDKPSRSQCDNQLAEYDKELLVKGINSNSKMKMAFKNEKNPLAQALPETSVLEGRFKEESSKKVVSAQNVSGNTSNHASRFIAHDEMTEKILTSDSIGDNSQRNSVTVCSMNNILQTANLNIPTKEELKSIITNVLSQTLKQNATENSNSKFQNHASNEARLSTAESKHEQRNASQINACHKILTVVDKCHSLNTSRNGAMQDHLKENKNIPVVNAISPDCAKAFIKEHVPNRPCNANMNSDKHECKKNEPTNSYLNLSHFNGGDRKTRGKRRYSDMDGRYEKNPESLIESTHNVCPQDPRLAKSNIFKNTLQQLESFNPSLSKSEYGFAHPEKNPTLHTSSDNSRINENNYLWDKISTKSQRSETLPNGVHEWRDSEDKSSNINDKFESLKQGDWDCEDPLSRIVSAGGLLQSENFSPPIDLNQHVGEKFIEMDEFLFFILEWDTNWIQASNETSDLSPICGSSKPVRDTYTCELDYYSMYIPRHLLSVRLQMSDSWKKCSKVYDCIYEKQERISHFKSVTLTTALSADVTKWPKRHDILLVRATNQDGSSQTLFGCVHSVSCDGYKHPANCKSMKYDKNYKSTDMKTIRFKLLCTRFVDMPTVSVQIHVLCNIRIALIKNEALKCNNCALKDIVFNPKKHSSLIKVINLEAVNEIPPYDMRKMRHYIVNSLLLSEIKFMLLDASISYDYRLLTTHVAYALIKENSPVLILVKNVDSFIKLASSLKSYNLILAVKAKEVELPPELKRFAVEKRLVSHSVKEIFDTCPVLVSMFSKLFLGEMSEALSELNSTCIIDDAPLCNEADTALPLYYGIKRFILMGKQKRQKEENSNLDSLSLFNRLCKIN